MHFRSANVRIVNSERAIAECLDVAFAESSIQDCGLVLINSSMGHRLENLNAAMAKLAPDIAVLGCSCSGVIGRDGVGEAMSDIAMMAVCGPRDEYAHASVENVNGMNSYEKGLELAGKLKERLPKAHTIYLLCPGIDIANNLVLKAFDDVFDNKVTIFGGTSSDNMRGLISFQLHDGKQSEHDAWAVGFADPTLSSITRATHGFSVYGQPLVVTKAEGNRIYEFDGQPAWAEYAKRLSLPEESPCGATIPVGALAEKLDANTAKEYGNTHILRAITNRDADGTVYYPVTCQVGTELWLTTRSEDLIFSEQARSLNFLVDQIKGKIPCAVFQTDCLARGRFLFNKIVKDELIAMMHSTLVADGQTPPWLGMYGFGEYAQLGGKNTFHNYSTGLLVLYR